MSVIPAPWFQSPSGKRVIYYHTSWANYGRNYQVKDLPIDHITDVSYSFFNIDANGTISSGDPWADYDNPYIGKGVEPQNTWSSSSQDLGNFGQFRKLLAQGKKFNLTLAIGGWTWSKHFSDAVATQQGRQNIISSLTNIFKTWPKVFNGISWDWEYLSDNGVNYGLEGNSVRKEDPENFIQLMKLARAAFPGFTQSICVGAAPEKVQLPIEKISELLDEVHIMSYDFHSGAWGETVTAHHCNPRKSSHGSYSAEEAADTYLQKGVPASKLFIGAAFYSRGFANTTGLGKAASGNSSDFQFQEEPGVVPYHMLPMPGATEFVDPESKGAYSYDPVKKVINTYDNVVSIKEKCKIVWEKNLAGIIVWESAGDVRDFNNPRSLMRAMKEELTHKVPAPSVPVPATPAQSKGIVQSRPIQCP
jgi:chitinase